MPTIPESWQPIADTLGYATEKEMLYDLYVTQGLSISELVARLGFSKNNIRRRLTFNGIEFRSRGGNNNLGHRTLASLTDEELMEKTEELAARFDVHVSTVFKERKRRGIECTSAPSPQQTAPSATETSPDTTSSSRSGPLEADDVLAMLEELQSEETSSSSTTEPTRES